MTVIEAIGLLQSLENPESKLCMYERKTDEKTEVGIIEEDDDGEVVCY